MAHVIADIQPTRQFSVFFSSFSNKTQVIHKGMTICYTRKNPLKELCEVFSITEEVGRAKADLKVTPKRVQLEGESHDKSG